MRDADIFITGMGIVSPAGCDANTTWSALLAGKRCIGPACIRDGNGRAHWCAGRVVDTPSPPNTATMDRVSLLAVATADEAVASADLDPERLKTDDGNGVGVSIGTSKGSILALTQLISATAGMTQFNTPGAGRQGVFPPWDALAPDAPARTIVSRYRTRGATHCTVAACATGVLAVIRAADWIREGTCQLALAGSTDAALAPLWFGAFERMGVLAAPHPRLGPAWACRPFDRSRQGFAIGEGAAVLVLESAQSVRRRKAIALARLAGWAVGTDPTGLTRSTDDGRLLARLIQRACRTARIRPSDLTAVHAHGTATLTNDLLEARALGSVLGSRVGEVPIVSIKGAVGHLLGAAGAVELAIATKSCAQRVIPGNATLLDADPAMTDLRLPRAAETIEPGPILKTSLGFGGHQAAVVIAPP